MCETITEGSLEVKLPTRWRDGKAEVARVRGKKIRDGEDQREKVRREKMQVRKKVGKPRFTVFSNDLRLWRAEKSPL